MAHAMHRLSSRPLAPVVVRVVPVLAPLAWLRAGWYDLRQSMAFGLMMGLIVVFPWLGHASWHAYKDVEKVRPVGGNRWGASGGRRPGPIAPRPCA